jgi:hypothetical protein
MNRICNSFLINNGKIRIGFLYTDKKPSFHIYLKRNKEIPKKIFREYLQHLILHTFVMNFILRSVLRLEGIQFYQYMGLLSRN